MRVSQHEKDQSHARIVDSAARLFRQHGIEGASVGDVMKDAGLTHGGFYRHFDSKDALLIAALEAAFANFTSVLTPDFDADAAAAREGFRDFYLSEKHLLNPGLGCPAAALGSELARGSEALKAAFSACVRSMIGLLSRAGPGSDAERQARATRDLAMMVGAIMLARASDPATAERLLLACRPSESGDHPDP